MRYLFHVDSEPVSDRIDLNTYIIPPNKAYRVEDDFHAEKIVEHKQPHHGIVIVKEIPQDDGSFKLDLEEAKERATLALGLADESHLKNYVSTQLQDRIRHNFPSLLPEGRVKDIIERRGIDIGKEFGLYPPGGKFKGAADNEHIKQLQAVNADLQKQLEEQKSTFDATMQEVMKRLQTVESTVS